MGVGSDGMERVGFEIGVSDDHRMSDPLEFPGMRNQRDPRVRGGGHTVRFSAWFGKEVCLFLPRST